MTSHDIERLTPLVEDLQHRGVVSTYATTSFPWEREDGGSEYQHGFWLTAPGLQHRALFLLPFTEDEVVHQLGLRLARQNHHAAISARLMQAGDQLLRDLGSIYASRLLGKALPVPSRVTIKDVEIPLPMAATPATSPSP